MFADRTIAYFTMEIGLDPDIPTYCGGLGILAGDSIRAAADLALPIVAVSLVHHKGYFFQRLDETAWQIEQPARWVPNDHLEPLGPLATVTIEGRPVRVAAWVHHVRGVAGKTVPVVLLDTDLPDNHPEDRQITDALYAGDQRHRLKQELVLGVGGVRVLRALGAAELRRFHMNEGHAAFLTLELLAEEGKARGLPASDPAVVRAVRSRCVFTTHTPIPAGHDQFPLDVASHIVEPELLSPFRGPDVQPLIMTDHTLNMTYLALSLSRYVNGVAQRHGEVSRKLLRNDQVDSITNGVHAATWAAQPFADLFDSRLPTWRRDAATLRHAIELDPTEIWEAHQACKREFIRFVHREVNAPLDKDHFTIGFARRATAYKRPELLLSGLDRLRSISRRVGPIQIVYAGKAHPHDHQGKLIIQSVIRTLQSLEGDIAACYLPNYDMALAKRMIPGVDLWLNTPQPPLEASGTSGMKAAINGVPSLSVLDGWWIEGCIEGVTGWAIGPDHHAHDPQQSDHAGDARELYEKLERTVVPMYYQAPARWVEVMRHAISINGSFFQTHRMMQEYAAKAYV